MNPIEHLAFAEAALLRGCQEMASWSAIEHIRRARKQLDRTSTADPRHPWSRDPMLHLSPTIRHYVISFGSGAVLAAATVAAEQLANTQAVFSWPVFGAAIAGGVVLFTRDWLHNNTNAFLEGTTPALAATSAAAEPAPTVST